MNSFFIAEIIYRAVIPFFLGLLSIYYYYSNKIPRLYKKIWLLLVGFLLIAFSATQSYRAYEIYSDYKASFEINTVDKDTTIESFDGYRILIPSGYKYYSYSSGKFSLIARQEDLDITLSISMAEKSMLSLEDIANKSRVLLSSENSTYHFSSMLNIRLNDYPVIRLNATSIRKDTVYTDTFYFWKNRDNYVYIILFSCPKENYKHKIVRQNLRAISHSFDLIYD